jgi:diguanylate cyclase (GGDEF)-like protein/PAS domain S-box-containing protein
VTPDDGTGRSEAAAQKNAPASASLGRPGTARGLLSVITAIMNLVREGVATLDAEGRVVACNDGLARMLGCPRKAVTGRAFASLMGEDDAGQWEGAFDALGRRPTVRLEATLTPADGNPVRIVLGVQALSGLVGLTALVVASDVEVREQRVTQLERMLMKLEKQRDELEQAVTTDSITGAYSSGAIAEVLRPELAYTNRYGETVSVLLADLDRFKEVNDAHGHAVGDAVLKEFCDRCNRAIRTTDYLIRYGGDEFVVVLPRTGPAGARAVAERIWQAVRVADFEVDDTRLHVTVSIGVATAEAGQDLTPDQLVHRADSALYQVKERGRDGVAPWTVDTPEVGADEHAAP